MKKRHAATLKKLALRSETLTALQQGRMDEVQGGAHFSVPPHYTCPECAPPGARVR